MATFMGFLCKEKHYVREAANHYKCKDSSDQDKKMGKTQRLQFVEMLHIIYVPIQIRMAKCIFAVRVQ